MKITNITKHPLIKIIGIITIVYFALFYNKTNPNSLGSRLSSDNLKDELRGAGEKTQFIITNINAAQQIKREKKEAATMQEYHEQKK